LAGVIAMSAARRDRTKLDHSGRFTIDLMPLDGWLWLPLWIVWTPLYLHCRLSPTTDSLLPLWVWIGLTVLVLVALGVVDVTLM